MIGRALCAAVLTLSANPSFATTWDEPWQSTIAQRATTLGLYEVKSLDGSKVVLTRKKHLAGEETPPEITTTGYTLLHLTSSSSEVSPVQVKHLSAEFKFRCYEASGLVIEFNILRR